MDKIKRRNVVDTVFLLGLCAIILVNQTYQNEMVIFILVTITLDTLLWAIKEPKFSFFGLLVLMIGASWWPEYAYFIPLFFYDGMLDEAKEVSFLNSGLIAVFLLYSHHYSNSLKLYLLLLCGLAGYLAVLTVNANKLQNDYLKLEEENHENNFSFEIQNSELIKQQEINIDLELSNERNRIARDIHDNVGHLLSSALLQTGALKAINQEEQLKQPLDQLQETITDGMNSIRQSVHDLHDESLSLALACQNIVQGFTFCEVELIGTFSECISKEYKLACIMLIKESLANVMKHSNADKVMIEFHEHPGFYKLTIEDNGTQNKNKNPIEIGIGLIGMQERIKKFGGRLSYHRSEIGFSVLALLPK